jgi:hypothetical protein
VTASAERPRVELVAELLAAGTGFLLRTDLEALGLPTRAVDALFRRLPIVSVPGYSRPMVRVEDYTAELERSTFRGDRVRPC